MSQIASVITFLVVALFIVTLVTDIITQVIKKITYDKIPTNLLCVIIALILSIVGCCIGASLGIYMLAWYHFVIAIVLGFFAAFIGMNGFDKFMQTLKQYESILEMKSTDFSGEVDEISGESTKHNE